MGTRIANARQYPVALQELLDDTELLVEKARTAIGETDLQEGLRFLESDFRVKTLDSVADDWPLTQAGRAAVVQFDIKDDPVLRCEPRGLPRMLEYPYAQRWADTGEGIAITIEHGERFDNVHENFRVAEIEIVRGQAGNEQPLEGAAAEKDLALVSGREEETKNFRRLLFHPFRRQRSADRSPRRGTRLHPVALEGEVETHLVAV